MTATAQETDKAMSDEHKGKHKKCKGKEEERRPASDFNQSELDDKLEMARMFIQMLWPYLYSGVAKMSPRWCTHPHLRTMAVDKYWRLYLDREHVNNISHSELALMLVGHELMHLMYAHNDRLMEHQDSFLMSPTGDLVSFNNFVGDMAINCSLQAVLDAGMKYYQQTSGRGIQSGKVTVPTDILLPTNFKDKAGNPFPDGLLLEDYAQLLIDNAREPKDGGDDKGEKKGGWTLFTRNGKGKGISGPGKGCDCGSGADGNDREWEDKDKPDPRNPKTGLSKERQDIERQSLAESIKNHEAKHPGTTPGGMVLWADVHLRPVKEHWSKILSRVLRSGLGTLRGDYEVSYAVPNRRSIATRSKITLPGRLTPKPNFALLLDTSGSMGESDYSSAFSHIQAILKQCDVKKVPFLACDTEVAEVRYISSLKDVKLVGGGGTDMRVGIEKARDVFPHNRKSLVICLTDGYTPWPSEKPANMEVVVVLTQKTDAQVPSFCRVVRAYDD